MTKFADELYADLMEQHGGELEQLTRQRQRAAGGGHETARAARARRPLWVTAGGLAAAAAAAAGFAVFGESTAAYAVTQNPDGTVTLSLNSPSGVSGANSQLKIDGDPVVVVPVRAACPSIGSLPHPATHPTGPQSSSTGRNGSVTINAEGLPAGVTVLVAAEQGANQVMQMSIGLITGPPPSCVSLPPIP
jgi:hypothetical protein